MISNSMYAFAFAPNLKWHLFIILLGVVHCFGENAGNKIRGTPWVDYPAHLEIPKTSFSCWGKEHLTGLFADPEADCQVFHSCFHHRKQSYLCPLGTTFNQPIQTCDYWYSSNCSESSVHFVDSVKMMDSTEKFVFDVPSGDDVTRTPPVIDDQSDHIFERVADLFVPSSEIPDSPSDFEDRSSEELRQYFMEHESEMYENEESGSKSDEFSSKPDLNIAQFYDQTFETEEGLIEIPEEPESDTEEEENQDEYFDPKSSTDQMGQHLILSSEKDFGEYSGEYELDSFPKQDLIEYSGEDELDVRDVGDFDEGSGEYEFETEEGRFRIYQSQHPMEHTEVQVSDGDRKEIEAALERNEQLDFLASEYKIEDSNYDDHFEKRNSITDELENQPSKRDENDFTFKLPKRRPIYVEPVQEIVRHVVLPTPKPRPKLYIIDHKSSATEVSPFIENKVIHNSGDISNHTEFQEALNNEAVRGHANIESSLSDQEIAVTPLKREPSVNKLREEINPVYDVPQNDAIPKVARESVEYSFPGATWPVGEDPVDSQLNPHDRYSFRDSEFAISRSDFDTMPDDVKLDGIPQRSRDMEWKETETELAAEGVGEGEFETEETEDYDEVNLQHYDGQNEEFRSEYYPEENGKYYVSEDGNYYMSEDGNYHMSEDGNYHMSEDDNYHEGVPVDEDSQSENFVTDNLPREIHLTDDLGQGVSASDSDEQDSNTASEIQPFENQHITEHVQEHVEETEELLEQPDKELTDLIENRIPEVNDAKPHHFDKLEASKVAGKIPLFAEVTRNFIKQYPKDARLFPIRNQPIAQKSLMEQLIYKRPTLDRAYSLKKLKNVAQNLPPARESRKLHVFETPFSYLSPSNLLQIKTETLKKLRKFIF